MEKYVILIYKYQRNVIRYNNVCNDEWDFMGYYSSRVKYDGVHLNKATWLSISDSDKVLCGLRKLGYHAYVAKLSVELAYGIDRFSVKGR